MTKFKVMYLRPSNDEVVDADSYAEVKSWMVFRAEDGSEIMRVKSSLLRRIERIEAPKRSRARKSASS